MDVQPDSLPPTTTAAVLHGALDIHIEHRQPLPLTSGQAQVQVMATGLCGSDLHYYQHGRNGDFVVRSPLCLGHEASGVVSAIGTALDAPSPPSSLDKTHPLNRPLQIGQRVAIEAGIMCRNCEYCLSNRYNLCKGMSFRSSAKTFPHADGTLQSHLNHPVSHLHPIPDHLSFQLAAMAEPLSVLLHATRRARLLANDHSIDSPAEPTVAIFGAGTIGLLAAALVSSPLYPIQASRVVLLDIDAARLDHAFKNGFVRRQDTYLLPMTPRSVMATWTVEQKIQHATKTIAPALEKFGLSQGVDCVYECSGAEPCIQMGIFSSKPGGRLLTIGMGSTTITTPLLSAATREVDIIGVFRYTNTYPEAIRLLSEDEEMQHKLKSLITHKFELDCATEAFELLGRGKAEDGGVVLKVMVGPTGQPPRETQLLDDDEEQ